ncbi:MAG: hypothetical protein QMD96_08295 [Anaerosomatales bacterium]|nr:hypothetical protein [Anaerosomatales bacterium]
MPEISPFQSPYKHWRSGLLTEIAVAAAFMALLAVAALVIAVVV